jgi:hypothetical protein
MPIIQKFLLILVLMHTDGSFTFEKTLVNGGCPSPEIIMMNMNVRQKKGEFVSWDGSCFPLMINKRVST